MNPHRILVRRGNPLSDRPLARWRVEVYRNNTLIAVRFTWWEWRARRQAARWGRKYGVAPR